MIHPYMSTLQIYEDGIILDNIDDYTIKIIDDRLILLCESLPTIKQTRDKINEKKI